jgi:hypothetical protein
MCKVQCPMIRGHGLSCLFASAGMAQPSSFGGSRDALVHQLELLNAEAKEVAVELRTARAKLEKAIEDPNSRDNIIISARQKVYDDLVAEKARLDERRKVLEAGLVGKQHFTCQPACCEQAICTYTS